METMTESTTDKRVDELSKRVDHGFEQVDKRINDLRIETHRGFDRVETDVRELRSDTKAGFEAVGARFDSLQRMMINFFAGTLGSIIAGVVVLLLAHS